jgi:hypothetical protein
MLLMSIPRIGDRTLQTGQLNFHEQQSRHMSSQCPAICGAVCLRCAPGGPLCTPSNTLQCGVLHLLCCNNCSEHHCPLSTALWVQRALRDGATDTRNAHVDLAKTAALVRAAQCQISGTLYALGCCSLSAALWALRSLLTRIARCQRREHRVCAQPTNGTKAILLGVEGSSM